MTTYTYTGEYRQIYHDYVRIVPPDEGETTEPVPLLGYPGRSGYQIEPAAGHEDLPVPPADGLWVEDA